MRKYLRNHYLSASELATAMPEAGGTYVFGVPIVRGQLSREQLIVSEHL